MSWPDDDTLPIGVLAAFGADLSASPATWVFTDLTSRLLPNPIFIRRGASDGVGEVSPGTCTAHLDNDDGALTPLNPASEYWPEVDLNVPILVTVDIDPASDSDAFTTSSTDSWGSTDGGNTWTSVGAGGSVVASDWQVTGGQATHSVPIANAYRLTWLPALSIADVDVAVTVSAAVTPTGAAIEPANLLLRMASSTVYYMARLSVAPGGTITASLHANGGTGQLASATVPDVTWSSGVALRVRAQCWGQWIRMRVWLASGTEPDTWHVTTISDEFTAAGGVGARSGVESGNTNTKPIVFSYDDFEVTELPAIRFDGFADSWAPTYVPTTDGETYSAVRVTASGLLRRLTQGNSEARSPLRRTIGASSPAAYWPVEDGVLASQAASAESGHSPLTVTGTVEFVPIEDYEFSQDVTIVFGTSALANLDQGGQLSGTLPADATAATTTAWTVHATASIDPATISGDITVLEWATPGGTYVRWKLVVTTSGHTQVLAYDSGGATFSFIDFPSTTIGFAHFAVAAWQSGGTLTVDLYLSEDAVTATLSTAATLAGITTIAANSSLTTSSIEMPFGHIAVWAAAAPPIRVGPVVDDYGELVGAAWASYLFETATDRLVRLAAEDGVELYMPSVSADGVTRMGPQPTDTQVALYRDCEAADRGLLYERMFGLGYRPRSSRYNLDPALTIDLSTYRYSEGTNAESVLAPVYDDQRVRNDWTVSRPDGSSARVVDEDHVAARGRYDDSTEVNVSSDTVLVDHASWRVHEGTWQEMRYPGVPVDLGANPDLMPDWLSLQIGDRVLRTNVPSNHPPGDIDQIVGGWSETLAPDAWAAQATCAPYGPWQVGVYDTDLYDSASTTLAADYTAADTSLVFSTSDAGDVWSTTDEPYDVLIAGERITVTSMGAVSGSGPYLQTATVTRGVDGFTKALPAGSEVHVAGPARYAL